MDLLQNVSLIPLVLTHLYNIEIWLQLQKYHLNAAMSKKDVNARPEQAEHQIRELNRDIHPGFSISCQGITVVKGFIILWGFNMLADRILLLFLCLLSRCLLCLSGVLCSCFLWTHSFREFMHSWWFQPQFRLPTLPHAHLRCLRAPYFFSVPSLASSSSNMISIIANIYHVSATKLILWAL